MGHRYLFRILDAGWVALVLVAYKLTDGFLLFIRILLQYLKAVSATSYLTTRLNNAAARVERGKWSCSGTRDGDSCASIYRTA